MFISIDKSLTFDGLGYKTHTRDMTGVIASKHEFNVTVADRRPSLAYMIERAWAKHAVPIVRPQDLWTTVAASLAKAVNTNEGLNAGCSKLFGTNSAQDNNLVVDVQAYEERPISDAMAFALPKYCAQMQGKNPLTAALCAPKGTFTTETPLSILAGQVLTMAIVRREYSTTMTAMCGLPGIIVEGNAADYMEIMTRLMKLRSVFEKQVGKGHSILSYLEQIIPHVQKFINLFSDAKLEDNSSNDNYIATMADIFGGKRCGSGSDIEHRGWILDFYYYDVNGLPMYKPWMRRDTFNVSEVPATIDGFNFTVDSSSRHVGSYAAFGGMTAIVFDADKKTLSIGYGFEVKSEAYCLPCLEYIDIATLQFYYLLHLKYKGKTFARWGAEHIFKELVMPEGYTLMPGSITQHNNMEGHKGTIIVVLTLFRKDSIAEYERLLEIEKKMNRKERMPYAKLLEYMTAGNKFMYTCVSMKPKATDDGGLIICTPVISTVTLPPYIKYGNPAPIIKDNWLVPL
jgi:hypothetical protein